MATVTAAAVVHLCCRCAVAVRQRPPSESVTHQCRHRPSDLVPAAALTKQRSNRDGDHPVAVVAVLTHCADADRRARTSLEGPALIGGCTPPHSAWATCGLEAPTCRPDANRRTYGADSAERRTISRRVLWQRKYRQTFEVGRSARKGLLRTHERGGVHLSLFAGSVTRLVSRSTHPLRQSEVCAFREKALSDPPRRPGSLRCPPEKKLKEKQEKNPFHIEAERASEDHGDLRNA